MRGYKASRIELILYNPNERPLTRTITAGPEMRFDFFFDANPLISDALRHLPRPGERDLSI
jgi:hypothetical protein